MTKNGAKQARNVANALEPAAHRFRDRVKELRRVRASELRANPRNWRRHPAPQAAALRGVLTEIGFADAVIARETPDGLELIDGHLRQEVMGDQEIPVLVVDVTEEEADKMLLTLDPLAAMAGRDNDALAELLAGLNLQEQAVLDMLSDLGMTPPVNPEDEWEGMPEFQQDGQESWKRLIVHFANREDMDACAALLGQKITEQTQSVWYPPAAIATYADKRYVSHES